MTTIDGGVIIKKGGGGGATINNQDKVVDITENGTTEVVADGGFTGLGKVTINTEVSGGGGNLSPDAIVLAPNGWYWKFTEAGISSDIWCNVLLMMPYDMGARYFDGKMKNAVYRDYSNVWYDIGYYLGSGRTSGDLIIYAISESIGCSVALDEQTTLVGDSVFEIINQFMPMTEAEFEAFMLENTYLQRITKEEYETLIIE